MMLVVGISLLALGLGNVALGMVKLNDYQVKMDAAVATGGESARTPTQGTATILDPSNDSQLLYELAYMKYEYYQVELRGGLMLIGVGSLLIGAAALRKLFARNALQSESFPLQQS